MNSVPDAFLDAVCSQLCSLKCLKKTSGRWSSKANVHRRKRRELFAFIDVNDEGTEVGIGFEDPKSREFVSSALDAKYDRITAIYVGYREIEELPKRTSLEYARTNVPHLLRSLAFDCVLYFAPNKPFPHNLRNSILYGLQGCVQLTAIHIFYSAEKVPEFVKHQIALGRLRRLSLNVHCEFSDDLQTSLRLFVNSPRFKLLDLSQSNLKIDFDMASSFVERFVKGDLIKLLQGKRSFRFSRLGDLHVKEQQWNGDRTTRWSRFGKTLVASRSAGGVSFDIHKW
uniref:F-box domain-containing protein n=1 Tax=Steinernema glaseri TaxID=37863 RepID=A0A1I7YJ28_9BILA